MYLVLLLKEKIATSKTKIEENKYKIELIQSKLNSAEENSENIKKLKELEVEKIKEKLQGYIVLFEDEIKKAEKKHTPEKKRPANRPCKKGLATGELPGASARLG